MKKAKLKQGTLAWENARETRIGSSEVFDIVKYYATPDELQNCGINPHDFLEENPYTSVWALYHKVLRTGYYQRAELPVALSEYGHALEPYGALWLQRDRVNKVKRGDVYVTDRLIASLDTSGVAEQVDEEHAFDYETGHPEVGQKFVCEQKTMMPIKFKQGIPFKYIIQAQYQVMCIQADFFILQLMVLDNDDEFIRGKICQMSPKKRRDYLAKHLRVHHIYFANNVPLAQLIKKCLERFFADVDAKNEPTPFIAQDSQRNIINSIRANSLFNENMELEISLETVIAAKAGKKLATDIFTEAVQEMVNAAKKHNACKFKDHKLGRTAQFSKAGSFLIKDPFLLAKPKEPTR